jgi:hypothetical protein
MRLKNVAFDRGLHHLRVKLYSTVDHQLLPNLVQAQCLSVRAVGQHRVNRVTHLDYPGGDRDLVAFQSIWITLPINPLVMATHGIHHISGER